MSDAHTERHASLHLLLGVVEDVRGGITPARRKADHSFPQRGLAAATMTYQAYVPDQLRLCRHEGLLSRVHSPPARNASGASSLSHAVRSCSFQSMVGAWRWLGVSCRRTEGESRGERSWRERAARR